MQLKIIGSVISIMIIIHMIIIVMGENNIITCMNNNTNCWDNMNMNLVQKGLQSTNSTQLLGYITSLMNNKGHLLLVNRKAFSVAQNGVKTLLIKLVGLGYFIQHPPGAWECYDNIYDNHTCGKHCFGVVYENGSVSLGTMGHGKDTVNATALLNATSNTVAAAVTWQNYSTDVVVQRILFSKMVPVLDAVFVDGKKEVIPQLTSYVLDGYRGPVEESELLDNEQVTFHKRKNRAFISCAVVQHGGQINVRNCSIRKLGDEIICECQHAATITVVTQIKDARQFLSEKIVARIFTLSAEILALIIMSTTAMLLAVLIRKTKSMRTSSVQPTRLGLVCAFCGFYLSLLASRIVSVYYGPKTMCHAATFFVHFFLLATFTWVSLEAAVLFFFIVYNSFKRKIFSTKIIHLFGWGIPFLIAGTVIIVGVNEGQYTTQYQNYVIEEENNELVLPGGQSYLQCTLPHRKTVNWAVLLPVVVACAWNTMVLITVCLKVLKLSYKAEKQMRPSEGGNGKQHNVQHAMKDAGKALLKLMPILIIPWPISFALFLTDPLREPDKYLVLFVIDTVLLCIQAVCLFFIFIVFNTEVRNALRTQKINFCWLNEKPRFNKSMNYEP
nr:adhesion G-protein coupled receptor G2-like [Ciona intestinalis]|eukprot:XP_018668183.1 adhesion G-protein coupled receptor G2-like [Ciona intestinalis]